VPADDFALPGHAEHVLGRVLPRGVQRLDDAEEVLVAYLRTKKRRDRLLDLRMPASPFPPDHPRPDRMFRHRDRRYGVDARQEGATILPWN
jgi:hypothetical protein